MTITQYGNRAGKNFRLVSSVVDNSHCIYIHWFGRTEFAIRF